MPAERRRLGIGRASFQAKHWLSHALRSMELKHWLIVPGVLTAKACGGSHARKEVVSPTPVELACLAHGEALGR